MTFELTNVVSAFSFSDRFKSVNSAICESLRIIRLRRIEKRATDIGIDFPMRRCAPFVQIFNVLAKDTTIERPYSLTGDSEGAFCVSHGDTGNYSFWTR